MKKFIVIFGIFILLFLTNPDQKKFNSFIINKINQSQNSNELDRMIVQGLGPLFINANSTRMNFIFFSIYTLNLNQAGRKDIKLLGILSNFLPIPL